MRDVYDYAKFFIKSDIKSMTDTFDGNMKLQKLLVFANLASIAEYGEPLFGDEILAFKNGCVVEKVRLRYRNDYAALKKDSLAFEPDFAEREYHILNMVLGIFGSTSAKELSEINHMLKCWNLAYNNGITSNGYHDKSLSVVHMEDFAEDIANMRQVLEAYKNSACDAMKYEVVNGVTYYYEGFELTEAIIDELENFSLSAEDDSYSVYLDDGKLVIF